MEKQTYSYGTGKRKTAIARVRVSKGNGAIIVNGIPLEERFPVTEYQRTILHPLVVTENLGKCNVLAKVEGGGVSGQCGAIAHGIARALVRLNENFRPTLRQNGLLTRDARIKERKKPGLRRARKAPQYTKR